MTKKQQIEFILRGLGPAAETPELKAVLELGRTDRERLLIMRAFAAGALCKARLIREAL